jgi:hypothetical protein
MGDWHISIQGTGQHHNLSASDAVRARDAEVMAAEFVQKLLARGHSIIFATFTSGGRMALPIEPRVPAEARQSC